MNTRIFADDVKLVQGTALCETALSGVSALPASGSFVDTRGHDVVHIIAHLGTLNASDTPTLEPKCSDAVDGTLDQIDASLACTPNVTDDDGDFIVWTIETKKLPASHYFLAVAVSGTVTNGSYVDVIFALPGRSLPVAQPNVSDEYTWVG
jgi:hypothetical protein